MSVRIESAYIELTSQCNMKCKHCFNESEQLRKEYMDKEEYQNNVKSLIEYGCESIILSGGEPLLHPDLEWMIKETVNLGIKDISVITNGLIYKESFADLMQSLKKEISATIVVSMDGVTKETYGILRDPRNLKQVKDNVVRYAESCKVQINQIMFKGNLEALSDMADFAEENKIESINLLNYQCSGRGTDCYDEVALGCDEIDGYRAKIKEVQSKHTSLMIHGSVNPFTTTFCRYLKGDYSSGFHVRIDSRGNLFPCSAARRSVGSLKESSLAELMEKVAKTASREVRVAFAKMYSECGKCEAMSMCRKGCPLLFDNRDQMKAYCEDCRKLYRKNVLLKDMYAMEKIG